VIVFRATLVFIASLWYNAVAGFLLVYMRQNNYAFIDSQNVNLAIRDQGWVLDWGKFRIYLREKYGVERAYFFIGYVHENKSCMKNSFTQGIF